MPRKTSNTGRPSKARKRKDNKPRTNKASAATKKRTTNRVTTGQRLKIGALARGAVALRAPTKYTDAQIRAIVRQCIANANGGIPLPSNAPVGARAQSVRACVNGTFGISIVVTGADSENSIVAKVKIALANKV